MTAAADASSPTAAGRSDFAVADGNLSAGAIIAAADARSTIAALRIDFAAFDGDLSAAGAIPAAADARSTFAALRIDFAAFDGDLSAAVLKTVADARSIIATGCIHFAAVDGDLAAGAIPAAADAGVEVSHILNDQRAHRTAGGLGVDGEAGAIPHFNAAVDGEGAAVGQNQVHLAVDGDTLRSILAADGDVALRYIPAAIPLGIAFCNLYGIGCSLLNAVLIEVEYISRPRCAEQHGPKRCALAGAGVQTAHRAIRIYVALCAEGNAGALLLRARSDGQLSAFPAVRKDSWQRRCRHAQCRYQCE